MTKKHAYITTAIPYVNGTPHIGHALDYLLADVWARYQRQLGKVVRFQTGVDEHGNKIAAKAAEQGMDPQSYVDSTYGNFQQMIEALKVDTTDFIRTTDIKHKAAVQYIWLQLEKAGLIYKGSYEGWYCQGCESFITDKEAAENNGICPDHQTPYQRLSEENYYFKASAFTTQITEALAASRAVRAQLLQPAHASLVARAACFDALADPGLFLLPELVEAPVRDRFGSKLLRLGVLVRREIAWIRAQHTTIELDDAGRHTVEEAAVVGHDEQRGDAHRKLFELFYTGNIEMIGGLVEEQQVGLEREGEGERGALAFAAREIGNRAVLREAEAVELGNETHIERVAGLVVRCRKIAPQREAQAEVRFIRQRRLLLDEGDRETVAAAYLALIEHLATGEHPEQGRLARAVASDQADALSRHDGQVCVVKERQETEGKVGIEQGDPGHPRTITRPALPVRAVQ